MNADHNENLTEEAEYKKIKENVSPCYSFGCIGFCHLNSSLFGKGIAGMGSMGRHNFHAALQHLRDLADI